MFVFFLLKSFVWPHLFRLVLDRGEPTGDLIAVIKKTYAFVCFRRGEGAYVCFQRGEGEKI